MALESVLASNLVMIAALLTLLWCSSLICRNVSLIDVFWGLGFVLIAWLSLGADWQFSLKPVLVTGLVTIWGLRLSLYLAWRNWGRPEDYRYAAMRQRHGRHFPIVSLFTVFGLQGLLLWIISIPLQIGIVGGHDLQPAAWIGLPIWLAGVLFESIGDAQLARFKADPSNRGQVMNQGLWRYTRHPNYFGDFLVWWGLYLVAAEPNSWWWTIGSPLIMSFLLIRVSGVRLLEQSLSNRVAGYDRYLAETSAFFPLPLRRQKSPE